MANITRLTMFALISALENDLRIIIRQIIDNADYQTQEQKILPQAVLEKAESRFNKCSSECDGHDLSDLISFIDYQEAVDIILRNINHLPHQHHQIFKNQALIDRFQESTQIRNRVMHSRPLEYTDLPDLNDLCKLIFQLDKKHRSFSELWEISEAIRTDPGVSLRFTLPECDGNESSTQNNLPLPDFDDTGYIGRANLIEQIVGLCKGAYPVISILGDGGIGKTALALKVAYNLVDDPDHPFDVIIWTSSKTTQLNLFELKEIDGAISNSLELFNTISDALVYETNDPIRNILEYLSMFRILLIIDNLETIIDATIINFLQQLPIGSKVLITSRIGLGQYEYPISIEPLSTPDAIKLLRNYAKMRGVSILSKAPAKILENYCIRMNSNPGYIKWFVAAVGTGKSPENILANPKVFLDFCMSNVYEHLSNNSKVVINSILSANREMNLAEIAHVSELPTNDLLTSIQQLISTNMMIMNTVDGETHYGITEFARKFLATTHPISTSDFRKYKKRVNQIYSQKDFELSIRNRYSIETIIIRNEHDQAIVRQLKQALDAIRRKDLNRANEIIEEAKTLSPGYFEVYRINAYIKSLLGASSEAEMAYNTAISLAPNQPQLYYCLGRFQHKDLGDSRMALSSFKKAVELDPKAFDPNYEIARMLLFIRKYTEVKPMISTLESLAIHNVKQQSLVKYLRMQLEYRISDTLIAKEDYSAGLSYLENFYSQFHGIPLWERTRSMKELVGKSSVLVHKLVNYSRTSGERERAKILMKDWLEFSGLSLRYEHAQVKQWTDSGSGLMILDSGEELYFRRDWFLENDNLELKIGDDFLVIKHVDQQGRTSARYIT